MKAIFTTVFMILFISTATIAFAKGGHDFDQKPVEVSQQEIKIEVVREVGQSPKAYIVTYQCPEGFRPKDGQCKKKHFWNK